MSYAQITGWGKCIPPASISNDEISNIVDTNDEWITTRTGIKSRRVSHVSTADLATVAAKHALACAGVDGKDIDLVLLATCTPSTMVANTASLVQKNIGAVGAAAMDTNAACSGFLYALQAATAQIRAGMIKKAVVIAAERMTWYINWERRDSAVLFGDGAGAVVLEASDTPSGLLATKTGCDSEDRDILHIENFGSDLNKYAPIGPSNLLFEGREIFKRAVKGMSEACDDVLNQAQLKLDDIDVLVPHQANLRIIQAIQQRLKVADEKVMVNIADYGNTSAATIAIAICEAVEQGLIKPNSNIMSAAFGAGLTWAASYIKWGERVTPISISDASLPPCDKTGLELVAPAVAACKAAE
ncbi:MULTISPECIES: ketoacyl-ACP synthase III [Pseudoalteromonas]|jgi:3-oxoacyl-[acyl-carrier-protein] synthase-3|uniref:Beta-ketoacyl-[acyl-carrier-protein] synthase III n=2 Tax=Pseudoalteromonas TaxID=53246 RepID=A0AAD0S416_9GAMM|nr:MULTISPECIES: ketoacyl-ACP synthase III [Pseudoalteromonas]AXV67139.1 ketoacyl-ACP synthase III [Pseudoalteromonas donghaensis]MBE0353248.1 3-oxoacyl-[acyl-carrier-protein] synthase III [Pseudoalteromonas lipolytica LMEB 39]MCC9660473.1 ketoacyl-ACP synthase III [Pseudoalteromonas sp. MB41]QLJ10453.1 ketoacyl-ACP synthase III [Pseudoalteromonas sp. JSTW]SFT73374.1 3-oxoacyl-[acyl-carrier-protein] synthase-3 [Pseudoalteromonas lipolytica]|tara:strand:- start:7226 stop:8299 length:1074 start_codon:yes stop_codon:yes gene_type:complete